jgi:hypothetical protein
VRHGGEERRRWIVATVAVVVASLLSGCAVGIPTAPTGVSGTAATLHGTVGSNVAGTVRYWFEYGTTRSYGSRTTEHTISISGRPRAVPGEPVGGLQPGTTYHLRMCAIDPNGVGPACSGDRTFVTGAPEDAVYGRGTVYDPQFPLPLGTLFVDARSGAAGQNPTGILTGFTRYGMEFAYPVTCLRVEGTRATVGTGAFFAFFEDRPGDDAYGELTNSGQACPAFRADLATEIITSPGIVVIDGS